MAEVAYTKSVTTGQDLLGGNRMTRAKVTRKDGYRCAPNGHTVEEFPFGEEITGKVAEWALADNAASRLFDPREPEATVQDVPPETKKRRGRPPKKKADK